MGRGSWVQHQFSPKITSSILVRGKQYLKTCSWGADFPYLALAVSLGRTAFFSALIETEHEHPEIRVHRRIILIFYLIFIYFKETSGGEQARLRIVPRIHSLECAERRSQYISIDLNIGQQHLRFLPNKALVLCTKASSHIRLCTSYFPIKQMSSLGHIWFFSSSQTFSSPLSTLMNKQEAMF